MHDIEPHFNWRNLYSAEEDERSPFFGREFSEFEFTNSIYGYCIHPQWDEIGSPTLFIKILFADYDEKFAVIEMLGEWNYCLHNDIMFLKRDIIDKLMGSGIKKFILIGENILNFHYSDESYYEEWNEDNSDGWIALLGFRNHVLNEFEKINVLQYFLSSEKLNEISWRTFNPLQLYQVVEKFVVKQLSQSS
ncbi:MAG: hypothetical protein HY063_05705 [Bacteroidetes bacterium]|nr:hypothetical protein [Bacteroidota bacterium]